MVNNEVETWFGYDDVALVPQYSEILSRADIQLHSYLDDDIFLKVPIITSPMDTVSEDAMAIAMDDLGGMSIIHRYNTIAEQLGIFEKVVRLNQKNVGIAVGTKDFERVDVLAKAGCKVICIDVAHGHHILVKKMIQYIKVEFPHVHIMAGNVATPEAVMDLEAWGAHSVRCLISNGSICATNLATGHGTPAFTTIQRCAQAAENIKIIADGGIKNAGDICKALGAGADFVMVGSLFSGTTETPGDIITRSEHGTMKQFKIYRGMASREAQEEWRSVSSSPEGISVEVPYRGAIKPLWDDIVGNIKSGFSYTGAYDIKQFHRKARFIRRTSGGIKEADTHILSRRF